MTEESNRNTGNWNTGDRNTGDWNTGNRNTGGQNAGDWNTGYQNTGDQNTGDWSTGDRNTGDRNTGGRNTGDWNAGYRNTGYRNTGDWNTGDWNTGNWHTGCFNTLNAEQSYYFNRLAPVEHWNAAKKPAWLFVPSPTSWVPDTEMTDAEKTDNPTFHTCGGYLRTNDMMDEWRKAYESASAEDIQMVRDLPNFDAEVFKQITGLDLSQPQPSDCSGKSVTIDGVTYTLQRAHEHNPEAGE